MIDGVADAIGRGSLEQRLAALRRSRVGLGLLAVLCGLGIAASGVTLVRAADDAGVFGFLRGTSFDRAIDPIRLRPRYAAEPGYVYRPRREAARRDARRQAARHARRAEMKQSAPWRRAARKRIDALKPRPAFSEPAKPPVARRARVELVSLAAANGRRTMCVRTCDGYVFPVGTLHSRSDLAMHQTACSAACPGAETRVYTLAPGQQLENPSNARSILDGTSYGRMKTAFLFRKAKVASCECQTGEKLATHLPILLDPTLRRGDVVVDANGEAKAFAGAPRLPLSPRAFSGYEGSNALTRTAKAQVDKLMGTTLRRKIALAYARSQGQRLASVPPAPPKAMAPPARAAASPARTRTTRVGGFKEMTPPPGSAGSVRAFTIVQQGETLHASGAQIITLQ